MSVVVEVPGHGEVEFPDGMSDADMEAAIRKNFMLPPKKAPMSPMVDAGSKVMKGLLTAGPMGAAAAGAGAGMEQFGHAMDKAAYGAGGWVTDKLGPEAGLVANIATQAIPTVAGGLAGKLASPGFQSMGRGLMQSALKPSKAEHLSGRGERAVQTMLDEGANVSAGGVAKLRGNIDNLNEEIAGIIQGSGQRIDKNSVASRLQEIYKKYEDSIDPSDLKAVEEVWTKFLTHPKLAGNQDMAIQLAQRMKQLGGRKLDKAYGNPNAVEAETDSWKALVRGLKEEISAAEPRVAPLNARESDLINASKIAANRVAMDANKNPLGLGALISQPWMVPLWLWDRSPLGKSLAARGLYSGAGPIGTAAGAGAGGLYGHEQGMLYP